MEKGIFPRLLDSVERAGNKLPDPLVLFALISVAVLIVSSIASFLNLSVVHPATGEIVAAQNLLSANGIRRILTEMVKNFAAFPPLGLVLVVMIGVGVAERSGLITSALKGLVSVVPRPLLPAAVMFAGINSNIAADAGYVVFVPLGAVLFAAFGRHPLAGLATAFAGVSAGFSANLLVTALDPLLGGLSTKAAQTLDPNYVVQPTANYYFMFVSTFFLTVVGTLITTKIIEPRLGPWTGRKGEKNADSIAADERSGLLQALYVTIGFLVAVMLLTLPSWAPLRSADHGLTPFYESIVALLTLWFLVTGFVFGKKVGTIKSGADVAKMTTESIASMGGYIVLVFVAAQFIAYFQWSNLGLIFAISGAQGLKAIGLTGIPLLIAFMVVTSFVNLFIGSASAKWAFMGPVFVPMLMLLGVSPEVTQLSYRIADSVTNTICPLLPYLPLIIVFAKQYVAEIRMGTIFSLMLPYSLIFFIAWTLMFVVWYLIGLPIGPDAPLEYVMPK